MTEDDLAWMGMESLARKIRNRELSSVELVQALLRRIARIDPALHSFVCTTPEIALAQARAADQRLARGEPCGPLNGVPIALKDLCWTEGVATTAGMTLHRNFLPKVDGTVTRKLREAGTVLLGKLKMTEGAFSAHHPDVVPPLNPWNPQTWTGVSSSGSGVAVAAGLCPGAIGTDTGGSIRYPSAANGVTGLKPTWGRVSRFGAFELAASLDHLGPMCRSATDCGLMLAAIAGADRDDPTALQAPVPDYLARDPARLNGLRVGIDEQYVSNDVEAPVADAVQAALNVLVSLGAQVVSVKMPEVDATVADWVPMCGIEAAVAHAQTYPAQQAHYGPMLAGLLDVGHSVSALDYQKMLLRRAHFTGQLNALMQQVDLLLMPAIPFAAPSTARIAELRTQSNYRRQLQRFTVPFDMSGHPTLTLPGGFTADGLPLAVQFAAPALAEDTLIWAGRAFQQVTDWNKRHPAIDGGPAPELPQR